MMFFSKLLKETRGVPSAGGGSGLVGRLLIGSERGWEGEGEGGGFAGMCVRWGWRGQDHPLPPTINAQRSAFAIISHSSLIPYSLSSLNSRPFCLILFLFLSPSLSFLFVVFCTFSLFLSLIAVLCRSLSHSLSLALSLSLTLTLSLILTLATSGFLWLSQHGSCAQWALYRDFSFLHCFLPIV